jgi:hypothetical protein
MKAEPNVSLVSEMELRENTYLPCQEASATNEACHGYIQRWFYNTESNACNSIGYSGCSQYGFATQAECEACLCD